MSLYSVNAVCVKCRSDKNCLASYSDHLRCRICDQAYPLIGNKIPVLVRDPVSYLSALYLTYEDYLRQQAIDLIQIKRDLACRNSRAKVSGEMQTAIEHNCAYIEALRDSLVKTLSIPAITAAVASKERLQYATAWEYLRRDWCWLPEGESELHQIIAAISLAINQFGRDNQSVAIIGAGTGRIACELGRLYEHVYAIDKSLTMARHFYDLLAQDILFYEVTRKNVYRNSDAVRPLKATLGKFGLGSITMADGRLSYWVGDGLDVPLADESISTIVSVHFTDLVPMRLYIKEIKRLLKIGGMFIHFGPLDYHFQSVSDSLSAEDVKNLFSLNGFDVVSEERIVMGHLESSPSMQWQSYNNWMFAAVNTAAYSGPRPTQMNGTSVLAIVDDVDYELKGRISGTGDCLIDGRIILPSGEVYEGAIPVLDILRAIDGVRTNVEVYEMLSQKYRISEETRDQVLRLLNMLLRAKVLQITN